MTIVTQLPIEGLALISAPPHIDSRGIFQNAFRASDPYFKDIWRDRKVMQVNVSTSTHQSTIRGLHFQKSPQAEAKIIRCLSGAVFDVAVDLRSSSKTFGNYFSCLLTPNNSKALFIPEGFAHGWQALSPNSQILYIHSANWCPEAEAGIRYDDPSIAIDWPMQPKCISERDLRLPLLRELD